MLDGDYRRLELRDSREGRVQLGTGAFGVELVAATCLEALQCDVERVLLILGITARDLESILRTAQIEVGDGQLRGQQHLEILHILLGSADQRGTSLGRFADPAEDIELPGELQAGVPHILVGERAADSAGKPDAGEPLPSVARGDCDGRCEVEGRIEPRRARAAQPGASGDDVVVGLHDFGREPLEGRVAQCPPEGHRGRELPVLTASLRGASHEEEGEERARPNSRFRIHASTSWPTGS